MSILQWTPLAFLFPDRHMSDNIWVTSLDFEKWSEEEYQWEQDGWNGFADFLTSPPETIVSGKGDCEDYAFVAASWARSRDKDVTLTLCFEGYSPVPQHMIAAFDGNVYSSDGIRTDTTIDEYIESSKYSWAINRKV